MSSLGAGAWSGYYDLRDGPTTQKASSRWVSDRCRYRAVAGPRRQRAFLPCLASDRRRSAAVGGEAGVAGDMSRVRTGGRVMPRIGQPFTCGIWTVQDEREEEFVARWTMLVAPTETMPSAESFLLIQDRQDPHRFISFGAWDEWATADAWRATQRPLGRRVGSHRRVRSTRGLGTTRRVPELRPSAARAVAGGLASPVACGRPPRRRRDDVRSKSTGSE
jgi:heme-degrading monooxygenase HmoA